MRASRLLVVTIAAVWGCSGDDAEQPAAVATIPAQDLPFCEAFGALLGGPLAEGGFDTSDPEVLRIAVLQTRDVVNQLRETAPDEVAAEAEAVAGAYESMFAVLDAHGYDLERIATEATPEEEAALSSFGQPPAGPGAVDPYEVLVGFMGERCAAGVTIPADLAPTDQP